MKKKTIGGGLRVRFRQPTQRVSSLLAITLGVSLALPNPASAEHMSDAELRMAKDGRATSARTGPGSGFERF